MRCLCFRREMYAATRKHKHLIAHRYRLSVAQFRIQHCQLRSPSCADSVRQVLVHVHVEETCRGTCRGHNKQSKPEVWTVDLMFSQQQNSHAACPRLRRHFRWHAYGLPLEATANGQAVISYVLACCPSCMHRKLCAASTHHILCRRSSWAIDAFVCTMAPVSSPCKPWTNSMRQTASQSFGDDK